MNQRYPVFGFLMHGRVYACTSATSVDASPGVVPGALLQIACYYLYAKSRYHLRATQSPGISHFPGLEPCKCAFWYSL